MKRNVLASRLIEATGVETLKGIVFARQQSATYTQPAVKPVTNTIITTGSFEYNLAKEKPSRRQGKG